MTEETFTRELRRRAEHVHGAPLTLDDVRGRARSIRRRRQALAGTAAAAVVAAVIVVPSVLAVLAGQGDGAPEPLPSPPPVAPSTPASSVLYDGVLTHPDGTVVPLDVDTDGLQQLGVLADGRIVVASSEPYGVQVYSPDGELESTHEVALNMITMSADDTLVAWLDGSSRATVLESGVAEPTVLGKVAKVAGSPGIIDAVLGSRCADGGCTVLAGDYVTTTTEVTVDGSTDLVTGEPLRVAELSPDGERWAVSFPPAENEQFGCTGLYDPVAAAVVTRSCDATLTSFSPDGRLLTSARGDNGMAGSVDVLDENLEVVLGYRGQDGSVVKTFGWADAEHLLVVVAGIEAEPAWSLLRVPVDGGDPEVVVGPVSGPNPELSSLFALSD